MRTGAIAAITMTGALAVAAAPARALDVDAAGNAFTGGLAFTPAVATGQVGEAVRWTNTDFIAPHTVTEDHDLFDLTGGWGATPINPPGFGPGRVALRVLEAGTLSYFCRVHPKDMRGRIAVPVQLAPAPARGATATWAAAAPAAGQVFDVELRRGAGPWRALRTGTTDTSAVVRGGKRRTTIAVRARLRSAADAAKATGWSPDATARVGGGR